MLLQFNAGFICPDLHLDANPALLRPIDQPIDFIQCDELIPAYFRNNGHFLARVMHTIDNPFEVTSIPENDAAFIIIGVILGYGMLSVLVSGSEVLRDMVPGCACGNGNIEANLSVFHQLSPASGVVRLVERCQRSYQVIRQIMSVNTCFSCLEEPSHSVALVLRKRLPLRFSDVDPYVSSEDIDQGKRWPDELGQNRESVNVGILCLTLPYGCRERIRRAIVLAQTTS